ncbi:MAG: hypothetical protein AB4206_08785 [Xenococcaceae cyanobacterium]
MLLNRLKIFLILLFLVFLSLFLWQNQELLSLKLLCADVNQSCFYQTAKLPLAIWMLIFTLIGVVTSLVWQSLNYLGSKSSSQSKSSVSTSYVSGDNVSRSSEPETKFTDRKTSNQSTQPTRRSSVETKTKVNPTSANNSTAGSDWEDDNSNDDWNLEESIPEKVSDRTTNRLVKDNTSYNSPPHPQTTQSSDTTYSYKSRPTNESKEQNVDRVYDANYRVINPSTPTANNEQINNKQDDEEWI